MYSNIQQKKTPYHEIVLLAPKNAGSYRTSPFLPSVQTTERPNGGAGRNAPPYHGATHFVPTFCCWWLKFQTTTWEYLRCIKPHYLIYRINWWTPDFSLNSRILKKSAKTSLRELTWIENSPLGKQTGRGLIALFFLLWGQLRKSRGISIYIYK